MKLQVFLETFYSFSEKASEVTRQLSFAGIAALWIFRSGDGAGATLPRDLVAPGLFFVVALASDLLQYLSGSVIWSSFYSMKERQGIASDVDIVAPRWLNKPIYLFFYLKILAASVGYYLLILYLWEKL